ncbi:small secreted hydrophilic protein [Streptomyces sp. 8K308]|uniref:small secreted hydrophilic protein n=1 Tax=Streptomyces sp. 8K308 TaxID=2530388 RepID=UPI0010435D41|nr:small secreted hydrophilic protein [Streptomyces sp. 8K308]TDC27735.1 small secreted hydrophilic protein [Streptomyces sp. 8K308]
MTFTHRMATLAAVVLIPVGIAGTSFLLSDDPADPSGPSEVELERVGDEQGGADTGGGGEAENTSPTEPAPPREDVVPQPSPTEGSVDDTPDDDAGDDAGDDADDADDRGDAGDDDG